MVRKAMPAEVAITFEPVQSLRDVSEVFSDVWG